MTEQEYNLEVICTCYSFEDLNLQYRKLCNGNVNIHNNQNSSEIIDNVSMELLDEAMRCYNTGKYVNIRNEMSRDQIKYGII